MEDSTISLLVSFIMPIGNLDRDYENISTNISEFASVDGSELILVVDSPPTKRLEVFLETASTRDNLLIISGQFGNPGAPRNLGMDNASGKWLSFIDSDDKTDFINFVEMIKEADNLNKDLVIGNYMIENNGILSRPENIQDHSADVWQHLARNPGIWRMGFKHTELHGVRFPEYRMGEDQVFLVRLRFWNISTHISSRNVYIYRKNIVGQLTTDKLAIRDLSQAQTQTLVELMSGKNKPKDATILSVMLTNQLLTSIRRLGFRGVVLSCRILYKSTNGMKTPRTLLLLFSTISSEIFIKIRRLRVNREQA